MKAADKDNSGPESRASAHTENGQQKNSAVGFEAPAQLGVDVKYSSCKDETDVKGTKAFESNGAHANVEPKDYDTGSTTTNDVRAISQAATKAFGKRFIAGHMLNNHLGGPGDTLANITAISSSQNSTHHSKLEKPAKDTVKKDKKKIEYFTVITKRADFHDKHDKLIGKNLASELAGGFKTNNNTHGPICIPLGPTDHKKKNEKGTGMNVNGAKEEKVPLNVELKMAQVDGLMDAYDGGEIQTAYWNRYQMDEEEAKADILAFFLEHPDTDPNKIAKHFASWIKAVNPVVFSRYK